jgi:hypothetical protein
MDAAVVDRPEVRAERTVQAPKIDGRIEEAAWGRARVFDGFTQKTPHGGDRPSEPTRARVLYDKDAVYVAIECEQVTAPVVARLTRRDRVPESDWVSVSIDTGADGKSAFELTVNAAGVLADGIHFDDTDFTSAWDDNWEARTARTPKGWSAEFRIPLRILRYRARAQQSWGLQVRRYISRRQETQELSYIPRGAAGEVSRYGTLTNLQGLTTRPSLELRPFVLGRVRHRDAVDGQLAQGTDARIDAGLDWKWRPSRELTITGALRPDFGQVEADQVVLNLSNFENWFPERRAFFLEGIDTFSTPMGLLYTRRIGATPRPPALRPNGEQLVDLPEPSTILGAVRVSGRLGEHWTIGTMSALTAARTAQVQLPDGSREHRDVAPTTAFQAWRVKRDLGPNAHLGLTATSVTRAESVASYPQLQAESGSGQAQLCPGGEQLAPGSRCHHDAYVASMDGRWRSESGAYTVRGQAVASAVREGPTRMMRDGTVIGPGDLGQGLLLYAAKDGGRRWVGDAHYDLASRKLDYNDLGYLDRQNQHGVRAGVGFRTLRPWRSTLETSTRLDSFMRRNLDGLDLGKGGALGSSWTFKNFWRASASLQYRPQRMDDREVGDGTALQRAGYTGAEVSMTSDPRSKVVVRWSGQGQRHSRGYNLGAQATVTLRAASRLELDVAPHLYYTTGEARFIGAGEQTGHYRFGALTARNLSTTVRGTYTLTPRVSLQSYAQLFLASGNYGQFSQFQGPPGGAPPVVRLGELSPAPAPPFNPNFERAALNLNVVFRWEYSLGSALYLVYTRSQLPALQLAPAKDADWNLGALRKAPSADVLMLKLHYWWG